MYQTESHDGVHYYRTWTAGQIAPVSSVLLMNLGHIGDFWMTVPALREARSVFRDARLLLAVSSWNRDWAEGLGLVDEVLTLDFFPESNKTRANSKAAPEDLRRAASALPAVDLAIDLRRPDDTRFILEAIPARHRCAFTTKPSPAIDIRLAPAPLRLPRNALVRRLWRMGLAIPFRPSQTPDQSFLSHCALEATKLVNHAHATLNLWAGTSRFPSERYSPADEGGHIAIVPLSNSKLRDWPMERYEDLIERLLRDTSRNIHFIYDSKRTDDIERERLDQLCWRFSSEPRFMPRGDLTRDGFFTDVATASLVISNNSGAGHISAQLGIPTLGIYTASHHPLVWGFVGPKVSLICGDVPCSACGIDFVESRCPFGVKCRDKVTADHVYGEAMRLLEL